MVNVLPEWQAHFDTLEHVFEHLILNPFDKNDLSSLSNLFGTLQGRFEFYDEPKVLAEIKWVEKESKYVVRVSSGTYIRLRLLCFTIVKSHETRSKLQYEPKPGKTLISTKEIETSLKVVFKNYVSTDQLITETKKVIVQIGKSEPFENVVSAFGPTESGLATAFGMNYLFSHEICHYWYDHFELKTKPELLELSQKFFTNSSSNHLLRLAEAQADLGAGTAVADWLFSNPDLQSFNKPSKQETFNLILNLHSGCACLGMLGIQDLLIRTRNIAKINTNYEVPFIRFAISEFGFDMHAYNIGQFSYEDLKINFDNARLAYFHNVHTTEELQDLFFGNKTEFEIQKDFEMLLNDIPNFANLLISQIPNDEMQESIRKQRIKETMNFLNFRRENKS